jgi:hypothetical protein
VWIDVSVYVTLPGECGVHAPWGENANRQDATRIIKKIFRKAGNGWKTSFGGIGFYWGSP